MELISFAIVAIFGKQYVCVSVVMLLSHLPSVIALIILPYYKRYQATGRAVSWHESYSLC